MVILLAWQLARLSWLLVPEPEPEPDSQPIPVIATPVTQQVATIDEREIAGWHLFGLVQEKQPVETVRPVDAPETRLKLTLHGVLASDEDRGARAIVGDPRGKEESYAVGDPLPGGARLSEIHPDRIILERGGRFETLRLPREPGAAGTSSERSSSTRPGAVTTNAARAAAFDRYRSEIRQNPASFLQYVRATPARQGGKFIGFTLQPGSETSAMQELGLQPGDIVTVINGVNIDSPAMGMKAMQALGEGDSVNVTLLRSGQPVSLSLTLPHSGQ
ncbi:MAG: type II secretion system protein GspC [Thiogranum sp.]|nr:type II secretion system protein GspC [Thiogranum sp.]